SSIADVIFLCFFIFEKIPVFRYIAFKPIDILHEIQMEPCAAEFAIGNSSKACFDLFINDTFDFLIFHLSQCVCSNSAFFVVLSCCMQAVRSEQTAYLIPSER